MWVMASLCSVVVSIFAAPGWPGVLGGGLAIVMMAVAAIDARCFIIPDRLVAAGLALGLLDAAIAQPGQVTAGLVDAALRGLVLALLFFVFRMAYRFIRRREGIGLGDVKLASVAGLWLGWTAAAVAIDVAALSALAVVLIAALRGQKLTRTTRVPFGLFFAPAIWVAWLFETVIARGMV
jgi:leader peptidase (prepilin peptidase) / N-methyltransferase